MRYDRDPGAIVWHIVLFIITLSGGLYWWYAAASECSRVLPGAAWWHCWLTP